MLSCARAGKRIYFQIKGGTPNNMKYIYNPQKYIRIQNKTSVIQCKRSVLKHASGAGSFDTHSFHKRVHTPSEKRRIRLRPTPLATVCAIEAGVKKSAVG